MKTLQHSIKILVLGLLAVLMTACMTNGKYDPHAAARKRQASADVNVRLAMDYLQKNNSKMAKVSLLKALKSDPKSSAAWYSMAYYMEVTGRLEKAEQYYQRAIKLAPESGIAKNNYGTFLCRHREYQKAIHEFVEAANQPKYLNVASTYENAGLCALLIPDNVAAARYFEKGLQNDPNQPTSLLELAEINYKQGNVAQAKEYYARYQVLNKPTQLSVAVGRLLSQKQPQAS